MRSLFWRCIRESLWRVAHARAALRVLAAADAMVNTGTRCAADRLTELRAYPWWQVRNAAVKLAALDSDPAVDEFLRAILTARTDVGIVRRNAVAVLAARPATGGTADTLRRCVADPYWEVRREAAWALARIDPRSEETFDTLCAAVDRERALEVRLALARALGATGNPDAYPRLESLADNSSWLVRLQSAVALVECAGAAPAHMVDVRAILARIERSSAGLTGRMLLAERMAALETLLDRGEWPAGQALAPLYLSPGVPWTRQ